MPMPQSVAQALATWQVEAPGGVSVVLLTRERFEIMKRNWPRYHEGLPRAGGKHSRPWQNRDMVKIVLQTVKRHTQQASLNLTAPITVHPLRRSYGQNHADNGAPIHVLQQLRGLANIATMREYCVHVTPGSEHEAATRCERLLAAAAPSSGGDTTDAQLTPGATGRPRR